MTAGLLLDKANVANPGANPELWEKVVRKLRIRAMPPPKMPKPEEDIYNSLVSYLESKLDQAALANPVPGRPVAYHRLNRAEYTNAIRDLLAVEFDAQSILPDDNAEQGFDNVGNALTVSPVLMESYLYVAETVSKLALGNTAIGEDTATYKVHDEFIQDERMNDELPFGTRGGIAIQHNFSVDGEYEINIKLIRNSDGWIRGLLEQSHPMEIRIDGELIKRFEVGGKSKGLTGPIHSRIGGTDYRFDEDQMQYEFYGDADLHVRFPTKAGNHMLQVYFLHRNYSREGVHEYFAPRIMNADIRDFKAGEPALSEFTIAGPLNISGPGDTPSRRKILICTPENSADEIPCARKILGNLARNAYRRPVGADDIDPLLDLYTAGREQGSFIYGLTRAIQGLLVSPGFLFRMERDPAGMLADTLYKISDIDLASRLSFFLWSSIPDDELLGLAEQGNLSEPEVLDSQVRRMLTDSRVNSLAENFAAQWLYLRNLNSHRPDNRLFPNFDQELRVALQNETNLLLESMIRDDRPVMDILEADYTFLNQRLADHYGIQNVYGSHFRRVSLKDENRRGLLGHGSILTLTSRPNRTAPVLRGKWILDNLLGAPPPPPPPDVPALDEKPESTKPLTLRQRMEQHRNNPVCASCHAQMDPFGFALDNFDPVGNWRLDDNGAPINSKVSLQDGTEFEGPDGVRKILLDRKQLFIHNLTEKLLIYALGRSVNAQDQPTVRDIQRQASAGNYSWSSIILGIVNSTPFQMRRSTSP
ncbi:MAG: DUF1592 domain-containing protein [Gammaproteobacteria bacterium]|nr:DUF1592 domain-containing protein [Gammaproteobacteria bacterium]